MTISIPPPNGAPFRRGIRNRRTLLWMMAAAALTLGLAGISWLSPQLAATQPPAARPRLPLAACYALACCGYALGCGLSQRTHRGVVPIMIVALGARTLMAGSPLIESDDAYRYVFDGHTLLSGHSPYERSPQDVIAGPRPAWLAGAPPAAQTILQHINHPEVHTIYPPLAQVMFALGAWLQPWSII